jgi:DNA-directed RNA polymerase subunit RPC12/RpoP
MISEAVTICTKYLYNFDTEKYSNPFAYFTLTIHRVFLTYIKKQKRHSEIKDELYESYKQNEDKFEAFGPKAIDYEEFKSINKKINTYKCNKCEKIWDSDEKISCPGCGSTGVKRVVKSEVSIKCNECGYYWIDENKNVPQCPKCGSNKLYRPIVPKNR